jgi:methyl-accepting chemotaxis protein
LKKTTISLQLIGEKLKVVSEKNQLSSEVVQKISEEVSSASTEQASSIQETVATLDEISSMINTAVEGSLNSTKKAEESLKIAEGGKLVVGRMIKSMEEIDQSNNTIMEEIKKGNERMAGIAKVISEISQKTTIINDIVFQTKLLSFNASVEAARAGEHGKGFAVVAEEVGNLAQMSGKASNEISQMLGTSINTVNNIILETNESIQVLFKMGNEKIKEGVAIADECGKVLDDVVENAEVVRSMMKEVSVASMEQSTGMKNIASAMNQLDQTTLSNTNSAHRSFQNSKELAMQSKELNEVVIELDAEIFGSKA